MEESVGRKRAAVTDPDVEDEAASKRLESRGCHREGLHDELAGGWCRDETGADDRPTTAEPCSVDCLVRGGDLDKAAESEATENALSTVCFRRVWSRLCNEKIPKGSSFSRRDGRKAGARRAAVRGAFVQVGVNIVRLFSPWERAGRVIGLSMTRPLCVLQARGHTEGVLQARGVRGLLVQRTQMVRLCAARAVAGACVAAWKA